MLPEEQYNVLNIITSNLGPHKKKVPFFFITGSAGTGESYIHHSYKLVEINKKYLLMAPIGAAQSIDNLTIHSALTISQSESGFQSLALYDMNFKTELLKIKVLIIDEISMVSASLGSLSVIVAGNLAQLPPHQ